LLKKINKEGLDVKPITETNTINQSTFLFFRILIWKLVTFYWLYLSNKSMELII